MARSLILPFKNIINIFSNLIVDYRESNILPPKTFLEYRPSCFKMGNILGWPNSHGCKFLCMISSSKAICAQIWVAHKFYLYIYFCSNSRNKGPWLLFVSESGFGKRVPLSNFRLSPLNRVGLIGYKVSYILFMIFLFQTFCLVTIFSLKSV